MLLDTLISVYRQILFRGANASYNQSTSLYEYEQLNSRQMRGFFLVRNSIKLSDGGVGDDIAGFLGNLPFQFPCVFMLPPIWLCQEMQERLKSAFLSGNGGRQDVNDFSGVGVSSTVHSRPVGDKFRFQKEWLSSPITLYFLATEGYVGDGVENMATLTGATSKTLVSYWDDMAWAAVDFYRVFTELCLSSSVGSYLRAWSGDLVSLSGGYKRGDFYKLEYVCNVGRRRLVGVKLSFKILMRSPGVHDYTSLPVIDFPIDIEVPHEHIGFVR